MSNKLPFYPTIPREFTDPIGVKSQERRNFEDSLTISFANSLSGSLASNYTSEYGSNNRVLYTGIGEILASLLAEELDLIEEIDFTQLRDEFLYDRLYTILFLNENERFTISNAKQLKQILLDVLESLLIGSKESAITDLLNKQDTNSQVDINQVAPFLIEALITSLALTTTVNDHNHIIFAKEKGFGITSSPLGKSWGDKLHTHTIFDGVIEEAYDEDGVLHTHEVVYGLSQDVIFLQDLLYKLLLKTKPAHVDFSYPSSLIKDNVNKPTDDMNLSMGLYFQEDLRKTELGVHTSTIKGYANPTKKLYVFKTIAKPNDKIKVNDLIRKVISITLKTPANYSNASFNFTRLSYSGTANIVNGSLILSPTQPIYEGEFVLVNNTPYFVSLVWDGHIRLQSYEINLNLPLDITGLEDVEIIDISYKTRQIVYRKLNIDLYNQDTFTIPLNMPYTIKGLPILSSDLICSETITSFNPYTREVVLDSVITDTIEITVPIDETDEVHFASLNNTNFVLNSHRKTRLHLYSENELSSRQSIIRNSLVLYKRPYNRPYVYERVESSLAGHRSSILNGTVANSTLSLNNKGFVLNKYDIVDAIHRVITTASGSYTINEGKIVLEYKPIRIISVKNGVNNVSGYVVRGTEIKFSGLSDGVVIDVVCLTNKTTSQSGDWFRANQYNENQVAFIPQESPTEFDVDDFMEDPLGNATTTDKYRKSLIKETVVSSGLKGEFSLYKDELLKLEFSGNKFRDYVYLLNENTNGVSPLGWKDEEGTQAIDFVLDGGAPDTSNLLNDTRYNLTINLGSGIINNSAMPLNEVVKMTLINLP
jgi:hypothetical protein